MKFQEFDRQMVQVLEQAGRGLAFAPGQRIFLDYEHGPVLYFLVQGRIRAYLLDAAGKEFTMEIISGYRVLGEYSLIGTSDELIQFEAITEVRLICLHQDELNHLITSEPQLVWSIMKLLIETINYLSRQLERLSLLKADERIAQYLFELTIQPHPDLGIVQGRIPYSHEDLANVLALQRPTVSRILKTFENNGWLRLEYGAIQIVDAAALKNFASRNWQSIKKTPAGV